MKWISTIEWWNRRDDGYNTCWSYGYSDVSCPCGAVQLTIWPCCDSLRQSLLYYTTLWERADYVEGVLMQRLCIVTMQLTVMGAYTFNALLVLPSAGTTFNITCNLPYGFSGHNQQAYNQSEILGDLLFSFGIIWIALLDNCLFSSKLVVIFHAYHRGKEAALLAMSI